MTPVQYFFNPWIQQQLRRLYSYCFTASTISPTISSIPSSSPLPLNHTSIDPEKGLHNILNDTIPPTPPSTPLPSTLSTTSPIPHRFSFCSPSFYSILNGFRQPVKIALAITVTSLLVVLPQLRDDVENGLWAVAAVAFIRQVRGGG